MYVNAATDDLCQKIMQKLKLVLAYLKGILLGGVVFESLSLSHNMHVVMLLIKKMLAFHFRGMDSAELERRRREMMESAK